MFALPRTWWARIGVAVGVAAGLVALDSVGAVAAVSAAGTGPWTATYSVGSDLLGNGDSAISDKPYPAKIAGLQGIQVAQISASDNSEEVLVLSTSGKIFAWGDADFGVGDGTSAYRYKPVQLPLPAGASKVVKVAAARDGSLALTATGQVLAWGTHGVGSLHIASVPEFVELPGHRTAIDISASFRENSVVTSDGEVWGWGWMQNGVFGNGTTAGYARTPLRAPLPAGFLASASSIAVHMQLILGTIDGHSEVLGLGDDQFGQLGNGAVPGGENALTPVIAQIPSDAGEITAVYAEQENGKALTSSGAVYTWGWGPHGTGASDHNDLLTPTAVPLPAGTVVTALATSHYGTVVTTSTDQILGWGENYFNNLSPASQHVFSTPTLLTSFPVGAVVALATTSYSTYLTVDHPAPVGSSVH